MESVGESAKTPLVLATKLYVPPPRPTLVARPRLTERLDASLGCKLTLVAAPAGFGKTTVVGEWAQVRDHRLAWLSLDAADNDPVRFWSYIIAALQRVDPRVGVDALAWLHAPPSGPVPFEQILTCLINELSSTVAENGPVLLVLDDLHVIQSRAIHETLAFLLDHAPRQLHLIVTSRVDPPLPLARLRARGELVELRAADLRFTNEETAEFLTRAVGLALSSAEITALETRTEGWIAGLQLAALSLRNRQDIPGFVAAFAGSNRYVLDYLVQEVLSLQPAETQAFLLETSVLHRLCAPLCLAVTGEESSARILESLDAANLFLVPLDAEHHWYRYHQLFAEFLRHRLKQTHRDDIPELYRRAAQWCETSELASEAISYALASQDAVLAARLVEQYATQALVRGEFITAENWLNALPAELVRSRARLGLAQAWTLLLTGRLDLIDSTLEDLERALESASEMARRAVAGEVTAIRAFVTTYAGNPERTIELCERALEELPPDARMLRSMLGLSLGSAHLFQGNLQAAAETLTRAIQLAHRESPDFAHYLTGCLLSVENVRGRLRQGNELCRQALELASQSGRGRSLALGQILVRAGDLLREENHLDAARPYLEDGIALGERGGNSITAIDGYFSLARLLFASGAVEDALALIPRIERITQQTQIPHILAEARTYCMRIYLAAGRWDAVAEWLRTRGGELRSQWNNARAGALTPVLESEYITLARALLGVGQHARAADFLVQARLILDELLSQAEAQGRFGRAIEIGIVRALALDALGDRPAALASLERALELAAPEGFIRLFADEGERMRTLLVDCRARMHKRPSQMYLVGYVDTLLAALPAPAGRSHIQPLDAQMVEPLSERELEILKLIADDASNQEIAAKLYLTVGTVKWHVTHILSKLDAHNRHQAVKRARGLNILR